MPTPHPMEDADWADIEDRRGGNPYGSVRDRVVKIGRAWEHAPGASLSMTFPGETEQGAAYRLPSNDRIAMEHILEPHQEATIDRCRLEPVVLAIQNTTTLNYNGHKKTGGLVNLCGGGSGSRGLLAHVGLAVTEARRPLGVSELNATQRDATLTKDPPESVPIRMVPGNMGMVARGGVAAHSPLDGRLGPSPQVELDPGIRDGVLIHLAPDNGGRRCRLTVNPDAIRALDHGDLVLEDLVDTVNLVGQQRSQRGIRILAEILDRVAIVETDRRPLFTTQRSEAD